MTSTRGKCNGSSVHGRTLAGSTEAEAITEFPERRVAEGKSTVKNVGVRSSVGSAVPLPSIVPY